MRICLLFVVVMSLVAAGQARCSISPQNVAVIVNNHESLNGVSLTW